MTTDERFERDLIGDTSGHDRGTSLWLASAFRATGMSRPGLGASVVAILSALATGTASLLLAIPILFVVVLTTKLLDGRARQTALRRARDLPIRLPEQMSFSDVRVRGIIDRLTRARDAIAETLATGPRGAGFDLANVVARVPHIERDVVVLAQRAEYLTRHLAGNPCVALTAEHRRMTDQIDSAQDIERATLLRRAAAGLAARVDIAKALDREYEQLVSAAEAAVDGLEALPSRMTLLQLRRLQACHVPAAVTVTDGSSVDDAMKEIERALVTDAATPAHDTSAVPPRASFADALTRPGAPSD
jgi:hypothetical protein